MNGSVWRAALPCALLLLSSMHVEAEPAPRTQEMGVTFELPRCSEPPYDDAQLEHDLELELSERGFRILAGPRASTPGRHFRLELVPECSSTSRELTLHVLAPDGRWLVQRRLPLTDIPFEARPRALAIAIAESLDRRGPSEAPARTPVTAAARVPPLSPSSDAVLSPPAASAETSSLQLGFAAQHRTPLLAAQAFWGGELNASGPAAWDALSWVTELAFATNRTNTRLGQMRTDLWSAGVGLDLRDRGLVELALGPRLGLGYVSARREQTGGASDPRPDAFLVLWGVGTELALPLGRGWLLRGTLDLEQPLRGLVLTAGGQRSLSLEGWLLTSGLGLAFRP